MAEEEEKMDVSERLSMPVAAGSNVWEIKPRSKLIYSRS